MKWIPIICLMVLLGGCVTGSYEKRVIVDGKLVAVVKANYSRAFDQKLSGLEIEGGDVSVKLDSQEAGGETANQAIIALIDLLKIYMAAAP